MQQLYTGWHVRVFRTLYNLAGFIEEARRKNIHFVVMRHSEIVAHVLPPSEKELALETLAREIADAREKVANGNTVTLEEIPRLEEGSIIVFPSFVEHRVTPVTEGIRYSLVSWFVGPLYV